MPAPSQSGIRKLSERAQATLHRLLDQGKTPAAIARAIGEQTRERISTSAITRYASGYRKRAQKQHHLRQKMDTFLSRVQQDGIPVSDLLRAVLVERLSAAGKDGTAAQLDLLKLEEAERKRSEFEMRQRQVHFSNLYRERELDLKERKHVLAEKGFQLQREKARANFEVLERKASSGESLTPDDLRRVREIYGLYEEPATATASETR